VFSDQIFQENTFLETKPNFSLTEKCFMLINFSNSKQIQESLESDFSKTIFQKTNMSWWDYNLNISNATIPEVKINYSFYVFGCGKK